MNTATPAVDQWDNWRRRLAGDTKVPTHDAEPQPGFYRHFRSAAPVAYWLNDAGQLRCKIDNAAVTDQEARDTWTAVCGHPVDHDAYKARVETGNWPGETAALRNSINEPDPDTFEAIQDRINDFVREAERAIAKGAATTKEDADHAANIADRLNKLWNRADELRMVEKRPHLDKASEVDDKWRPLTTASLIYKKVRAIVTQPYLKKLEDEKLERERAAAAAATEARRKAEQAILDAEAAQRSMSTDMKQIEAAKAAAETAVQEFSQAQATAEAAAAAKVTVGTIGRSTHLRKKTVVTIADRAAVLAHFADREEITELLQTMAERSVKAGVSVPGVIVSKDSSAT
jgi:hypothetical protein